MLMNLGVTVILLLCLVVFGVIPLILIRVASRRRPTINSSLQECPDCGAHNPKDGEHCYCCGFGFILPQSDGTETTVNQRVKQADDSKMRRNVGTQLT